MSALTELSITTAPPTPSLMASACSREKSPLTAKKTTSHSRALSTSKSSTVMLPYLADSMTDPADRADPKMRSCDVGKDDFSKQVRISLPTAPVAPTMATVYDDDIMLNGDVSNLGADDADEARTRLRGTKADDLAVVVVVLERPANA
jgi:hypothetical protein